MAYRNIEINGRAWRFKVGKAFVDIRGPEGEKFVPTVDALKGFRVAGTVEEGRWEGNIDGMIGPGDVRRFIERQPAKT